MNARVLLTVAIAAIVLTAGYALLKPERNPAPPAPVAAAPRVEVKPAPPVEAQPSAPVVAQPAPQTQPAAGEAQPATAQTAPPTWPAVDSL